MVIDRDGKELDEFPKGMEGFISLKRLIDILESHECNHREEIKAVELSQAGIRYKIGYRDI